MRIYVECPHYLLCVVNKCASLLEDLIMYTVKTYLQIIVSRFLDLIPNKLILKKQLDRHHSILNMSLILIFIHLCIEIIRWPLLDKPHLGNFNLDLFWLSRLTQDFLQKFMKKRKRNSHQGKKEVACIVSNLEIIVCGIWSVVAERSSLPDSSSGVSSRMWFESRP